MHYKIAVASGKGGTGKTTVSVNLFRRLSDSYAGQVQLVDCDVEEPNDLLFFDTAEKISNQEIHQLLPVIDTDACTYCSKCVDYCQFNAISIIPNVRYAQINHHLCHSCGACLYACKQAAISETAQSIGTVNTYCTHQYSGLYEGVLKVGSAMHTMLIKELKKQVAQNSRITIYDAPPGTSCPVVATVSDAAYVVLVAEPTLFGLHDLKLMVALVRELDRPFGVIVNKAGMGNDEIYTYLEHENIDILGQIPFSKDYARMYAEGNISETVPSAISTSYEHIMQQLHRKTNNYEGNYNTQR